MANLSHNAVSVEFSVSMPRWSKKAEDLAQEAAANHQASAHMHSHTERTLDKNAISDLTRWEASIRTFHRENTVPFMDNGRRLIGNVGVQKYKAAMDAMIDAGRDLWADFLPRYQTAIADARYSRGDRFDPNDYPDVSKLHNAFKVHFAFFGAPDVGSLPAVLQGIVGAGSQQAIDAAMDGVKLDILNKLRKPIAHLQDKLTSYSGGRKGSFHDTITTNIAAVLDVLPALNVNDDPQIDILAAAVKAALLAYTPDELRDSDKARDAVVDQAQGILAAVDAITNKMDEFV